MNWKGMDQRSRLRLTGIIILLAGLAGAALIYITAGDYEDGSLGYEESKIYVRDLEMYGGKANVLAYELTRWFSGLWHGKQLAWTVATGSIIIALVLLFVARQSPPDP